MPSVYIKTYGCQMNERDSEAVAAQLVAKGYSLAASEAAADVVLLNTCSVRDLAEQKALRKMRAVAGAFRKQRKPGVLGFMGCMAQSRGRELVDELPDVDLVVGTQRLHRVADYVGDLLGGEQQHVVDTASEVGSESKLHEHLLQGKRPGRAVTAFVSIMQGCNQFCTFCIVPSTRGLERSRSIEEIVRECEELAARGVREVTLLGQIVTGYGRREIGVREGKSAFVQLLEAVEAVEGLERIRFTSPHPKGYGTDLVEAYGRLSKLCEYAHLPVQSGSNRVLRLMHRGYTRERYLELVTALRRVRPGIGLCTDLIVGFPGETEADFEATCSLVREVGFDQAFVFKYSPRKDTPAARMPGALPQEVIEARHGRMLALVNEAGSRRYRAMVGSEVEVLVEGPSRKNPARLEGRTRSNKIVVHEGSPGTVGRCVRMEITRAGTFTLYGRVTETQTE
jgi:tRNA-2-methylthio-N6-dimethylallyladenosine synthase